MRDSMVDTQVIEQAVKLACRAPSLHNSQPWRWVVEGNTVHLFEDKDRVLYATDHTGREALLGCGAVLDHFRVAMAAAGFTANVDRFPNPNNPMLLASVDFTPMEFVTDGHRRRADAILRRRTDRLPFGEPPNWHEVETQMQEAVSAPAVRFDVIPDEFRHELADASQLAETSRLYDSSYHAELARWTRPYETGQGIPPSALVSADESDRVDVGRNFPVTPQSDRRVGFGEDHSKIVVLSTYDSERGSVLQCGEMLSAVLLEATMAGLATCTLTHITELHAGRNVVAALIDQTSHTPSADPRRRGPRSRRTPAPDPQAPSQRGVPGVAERPLTTATGGANHAGPRRSIIARSRRRHRRFAVRGQCRPVGGRRGRQSRHPAAPRVRHRSGHTTRTDTEENARELAAAEIAVRHAYTAVESTDKPVKIEIEILQKNPTRALIESSRSAALLCVGSIGLKHSTQGRIGSTAATLATAAHCPVAVVHGFDSHLARQGWVVAELDEFSTLDGILQCALEEARLRGSPLRVLTTWQSRFTDIHDGQRGRRRQPAGKGPA